MALIVKNTLLNNTECSIRIEDGTVTEISNSINILSGDQVLEAGGMAAVPSFKNGHGHSPMTLLRGWGDDMKLHPWLEEKIWPRERDIAGDSEACYWGTRMACLEMIKSGTTFVNDMYFNTDQTIRAFTDSGVKAATGTLLIDFFDPDKRDELKKQLERDFLSYENSGILTFTASVHSVYTVSKELLRWVSDFAAERGIPVHIHLSETKEEVDNCIKETGKTPAAYLDGMGFFGQNTIAAHAVWLTDDDIKILAENGTTVVHNPVSNMKLAVGNVFPFEKLKTAGVPMMLGTDGTASNNNLSMLEEMKIAALLQKHHNADPTVMKAREIFDIASGTESRIFPGISGKIKAGDPADLLLMNRDCIWLLPDHNLISNLVYSAQSSCIDTVISGGKILMEKGKINGEETVIEGFRKSVNRLFR